MLPPSSAIHCGVCGHDVDPRSPAFVVECHFCGQWLHGVCAQVSEQELLHVAKFACASCSQQHDSVKFEPSANNGPFDAGNLSFSPLPVHLRGYSAPRHKKSSPSFRRLLGAAIYARSGVHLVASQDVQPHFLQHHPLEEPVLLAGNSHRAAGLDEPFPVLNGAFVAKLLAENALVRATDVGSQTKQELNSPLWQAQLQEDALLANAEFRLQTSMTRQVAAPIAVAQVDWNYLVSRENGEPDSVGDAANANVFGAFLEKNAYLDFALAPGGQSTWLSVSAGELWVYLIAPTTVNFAAFRDWKNDPDFATAFLAERVEKCTKCVVSAGSSLVVPAGWMYARFAGGVQSCSVFQGFFACTAAMEAQLGVVMLEMQYKTLAQYWSETVCGWLTVDANVQLWMAICSYVRQLLATSSNINARVSEQDRRALARALPRLREWSAMPASLKSVDGITWTPSSLQEGQSIVGRLEQALTATYVPSRSLDSFQPTTGLASDNKLPPISPNEANYIYSAASAPDSVSGSPWGSASTGMDSTSTSNFNSSTPMWSNYNPMQQEEHLILPTQSQPYLHSDPSLQPQSNQAFAGAEYGYLPTSATALDANQDYMGPSHSQTNLGLEGLNSLSSASLEIGATGTPLVPGHNFQQPRLDSNGNFGDLMMRHRASCHRCGNLRKKNVRCPACPHIFCAKCADKMVEEHGDRIFENGCPVCKELCCCGKNRTTSCTRKFHCYKKCPSTKRPAAG